jgi:DedD protein
LQAGVFSSAQRAEELHAKLTLSGVPSTLETRVQVGPFRTRQEAEAAQSKLKELGIEAILVPPKR